ncbi:hypothetical protein AB0E13_38775, partial [Streptomyces tendae]
MSGPGAEKATTDAGPAGHGTAASGPADRPDEDAPHGTDGRRDPGRTPATTPDPTERPTAGTADTAPGATRTDRDTTDPDTAGHGTAASGPADRTDEDAPHGTDGRKDPGRTPATAPDPTERPTAGTADTAPGATRTDRDTTDPDTA